MIWNILDMGQERIFRRNERKSMEIQKIRRRRRGGRGKRRLPLT
jgi:hypothetical protein